MIFGKNNQDERRSRWRGTRPTRPYGSNFRILASNCRGLNGLGTKSSQPAARALASSSLKPYDVTTMIGTSLSAGSALIRRVVVIE
jgi:hypothetical protein